MLRNYLLTIMRQAKKNKTFSFINVMGLAVGMSACLVIAQFVFFHSTFDRHHSRSDQIFRIHITGSRNGQDLGERGMTAAMYAPTITEESPDVLAYGRFWGLNYLNNAIIYKGENVLTFDEPLVYGVDRSIFDIFDFRILAGSIADFDAPLKAILTSSSAQKYFKDFDAAIGQTFTLSGNDGPQDYELVAVIADLPKKTHLNFGVLVSMKSIDFHTKSRTSWYNNVFYSYLLLDESANTEKINLHLSELYEKHSKEGLAGYGYDISYHLMPMNKIHLNYTGPDFVQGVDIRLVVALSAIALIILIIAWINYLNLALVKAVDRMKEVGIRKAMGSSTGQITSLFMMEAVFLNVLSFMVAMTFTQLASPFLANLTNLEFNILENIDTVLILFLIVTIGTVIIGYYPAIILRAFNTSNILLGNRKPQKIGGVGLRSALVSLQFIITFLLIATTLTVNKQVNFMKSSDLGVSLKDIMVIKAPPGDITSQDRKDIVSYNTFKTEVMKTSGITMVTNGGEVPGTPINWNAHLYLSTKTSNEAIDVRLLSCGVEYLDFFALEAIAGRKLRQGDDPWEKGDVVINEKLSELLGFENPEDAIGAELSGFYGSRPLEVRGVIENHNHISLHHDIKPIAFLLSSWTEFYFVKFDNYGQLSKSAAKDRIADLTKTIGDNWQKAFPDNQFDYFFLDEFYDRQYESDDQFGLIFSTFSSLAILIACLGLFGLTSFTLQQRTKEIGIRKVLGARTSNLVILLSKNYFITILIAYMISMPVAWFLMQKWLENYTFRIELGIWLLFIPLGFVITVAILTILSRLLKSVSMNPVDSLRYE